MRHWDRIVIHRRRVIQSAVGPVIAIRSVIVIRGEETRPVAKSIRKPATMPVPVMPVFVTLIMVLAMPSVVMFAGVRTFC